MDLTQIATTTEKRLDELKAQMKKESREALQQVFQQLFEKFPQVKTVYWAQYTPYFNDGDACTFSIHDVNFSPMRWDEISGPYYSDEAEEDDQRDFSASTWGGGDARVTPELAAAITAVSKFLNAIEDQLAEVYGDHCWVRVHKDGVQVEDHDHD